MKYVTRTSEQAKIERQELEEDNRCPECGNYCIGLVTTKSIGGLFSKKIERRNNYSCMDCGTEWNTGWK